MRDTPAVGSGRALRLPALQQAQDRPGGFAPLHSLYIISLLNKLLHCQLVLVFVWSPAMEVRVVFHEADTLALDGMSKD